MHQFSKQHILSTNQFSREDLDYICQVADKMKSIVKKEGCCNLLNNKLMASLFYEPSTRTRFSFEAAMRRLGGSVIADTDMQFSSFAKGETLEDTIRVIGNYADVIVMRHPEIGSAARAAKVSSVPVLNAGDGPGEHPTQALLDFYTIKSELGRIDNFTISMVGDLKYGRTIRSLAKLLAIHNHNIKVFFVAPPQLKLENDVRKNLLDLGLIFTEIQDLKEAIAVSDVCYMTRIQKERFLNQKEYNKLKGCYVLDNKIMKKAKKNMIIMHPLPRVGEILEEVDKDPRAKYFQQAENGMYVRMALLLIIFGRE